MKVLYIGHYKERGGWANAAQNLIRAIHSVGVEVVCRNITLTQDVEVSDDILKLEQGNLHNVDYCIQHVLPHHLVGSGKFKKNVSYAVFESCNLKYNMWLSNLAYMDEVWVPCSDNKKEIEQHISTPVHIVPHAFDLNSYQMPQLTLNFDAYGIKSAYKFYTIADVSKRKNIESIIRTYYSTFFPNDNVALILKVNKFGYDKTSLYKFMEQMCENIRNSMGIYDNHNDYNKIVVISEEFSPEQIKSLHATCDCFINLSHGEAWSIPSFDAMCFGNHPICVNWGGPKDYIDHTNKDTGYLINYSMQTCTNDDAAFRHIFKGREFWATPDELEASKAMRHYYDQQKLKKNNAGYNNGMKFDLSNVGNTIKELLLS